MHTAILKEPVPKAIFPGTKLKMGPNSPQPDSGRCGGLNTGDFSAQLLRGKLHIVELLVRTATLDQLIVPALFHNPALFQNHNQVGMDDRRKPVRDADRRASFH
jgi:hypothetical protein